MSARFLLCLLTLLLLATPAQANCVDNVSDPEFAEPIFSRWFAELQARKQFSWGAHNPYARFSQGEIHLSSHFDALNAAERAAVLDELHLDLSGKSWYQLLQHSFSDQELEKIDPVRIGARHPYPVYASDGRLLSAVYDGCTRMLMLTERARFQWASLRSDGPRNARYNVGHPPGRIVRHPITARQELQMRRRFWQRVGWSAEREYAGWWIAWVPEHGWFEINLPSAAELPLLRQRFLNPPPAGWKFVVVDQTGTQIWP